MTIAPKVIGCINACYHGLIWMRNALAYCGRRCIAETLLYGWRLYYWAKLLFGNHKNRSESRVWRKDVKSAIGACNVYSVSVLSNFFHEVYANRWVAIVQGWLWWVIYSITAKSRCLVHSAAYVGPLYRMTSKPDRIRRIEVNFLLVL